jgi:putative transposase
VGEGGDEVSVARFIADQRTKHRVPHAFTCRTLQVSEAWFYKWRDRPPTDRQRRRAELDADVRRLFDASDRSYGSPRIHRELLEAGWRINAKTIAESMQRQGMQGRKPKRRKGLTKQDKNQPKFPDLLRRDFTAAKPNLKWCGDITEIPTAEGKLFLATVLDLFSHWLLVCPTP